MNASDIFQSRSKLISKVDLFKDCSESLLREVAMLLKEQTFKKNTQILCQGDKAHNLYIIISGRANVFINDQAGDQTVLSFIDDGDHFGELSLFDDIPRPAGIVSKKICLF